MEIREGNIIVSVDKILTPDKNEFLRKTTELLGKLIETENELVWVVAADGILKTALAVKMTKDMIGEDK